MARKPLLQTRIEGDTYEAFEAFHDELGEDVTKSEAVRHLLRAGLNAKGHPVAATDGGQPDRPFLHQISAITASVALVGLLGGLLSAAFATAGISLTPWALATPLAYLGITAGIVATVAYTLATPDPLGVSTEVEA